jgi:hypothetical protein
VKKMKQISEKQAWAVLQIVFSRRTGICKAINELDHDGLISKKTWLKMHKKVQKERVRIIGVGMYLWPVQSAQYDHDRVAFCAARAKRARK